MTDPISESFAAWSTKKGGTVQDIEPESVTDLPESTGNTGSTGSTGTSSTDFNKWLIQLLNVVGSTLPLK